MAHIILLQLLSQAIKHARLKNGLSKYVMCASLRYFDTIKGKIIDVRMNDKIKMTC